MTPPDNGQEPIKVLLIDDQLIIGEAVRRLLAGEDDIRFRHCPDPSQAFDAALEFQPTVILQDLVMPEIDGITLVRRFREHEATRIVPMIVLSTREEPETKAEAFAVGANDYLVKLPSRLELLARVRHHSHGYQHRLQRDEAYRKLAASQKILAEEVAQAAKYVRSLLPRPIRQGPVRADWRFIPSAALGGDTFGYHWLDEDRFAFYLLDVVGHGVGAALLSVSVLNLLRERTLPNVDFLKPDQVINGLNQAFQMSRQADKYFTAWYGVFDKNTRVLEYAGGSHPPALLVGAAGSPKPEQLQSTGPMVGAFDDIEYGSETCEIPPDSKLFLYSDGVFEIELPPNGTRWPFPEFTGLMGKASDPEVSDMDRLIRTIRELTGKDGFDDDFSIVELRF